MSLKQRRDTDLNYASTAASLIIDSHYAKLNIKKRWTQERIERLCSFLRITHGELASLLGVNHSFFERRIISGKPFSGPICIILTIIEAKFLHGFAHDVITNLFNFHGKQEDTPEGGLHTG